jgi:quercetin dioxygenase-like cupin family protein
MKVPHFSGESIYTKRLVPVDLNPGMEPYLVEIPVDQTLNSHFFSHKGEEMGFVISGELQLKVGNETHTAHSGDVIILESENPNQWKNIGTETARLWWIKARR